MNNFKYTLDHTKCHCKYFGIELRNSQTKLCFQRNNLRCRLNYNAIYSNSKGQLKRVSVTHFLFKRKASRYYDIDLIHFCIENRRYSFNV